MKKISLGLCILALSACATVPVQKDDTRGFDGIWEGTGLQDNNSSWTIKVAITGGQYSIDYPSLGCGGRLTLLQDKGDTLEFRETLTYGTDKCINNGKAVLIKAGANSAQYQWYYEDGRKGAMGTLTRQ